LIELDGVRLLTDPLLRGRVTHLKRVVEPVDVATLEDLDAVLLSHLHFDHLDVGSLTRLGQGTRMVVPRGGGDLLRKRRFEDIVELRVGEEVQVGAVRIRATLADHDPRRAPFASSAPAVGYVIDGTVRIYFAGDTDLFDEMSDLSERLDVALIPVAGWGRRVPAGHLDPPRAAEALRLLRPRVAVPIHWGTYRQIGLSRDPEALRDPAETFERLAHELAPEVDVRVLPVGGSLDLAPVGAGKP
jgi:L-ascorbate metabolism protein UlaG (beta-lactamase superfamily)